MINLTVILFFLAYFENYSIRHFKTIYKLFYTKKKDYTILSEFNMYGLISRINFCIKIGLKVGINSKSYFFKFL